PVALKRLHGGGAEDHARIAREARAAAQLQHANVVAVYEVGEAAGAPFLARELVDGETLTRWLRTPRRWREIAGVLAQAGRGLAAAHARGLVHRDFKPDNVLVGRDGRARVADFGLARAHDGPGARPPSDARLGRMTETGAISGTPAYLAPELIEGAPPDARSDQYAFAITAFEALHGQHPFEGTTAPALWAAMASGKIRDGRRPIPAWLDRAVRRGLAVDPAKRWPDVASLVAAIDRAPPRRWPFAVVGALAAAALAASALPSRGPSCDDAGGDLAWPARRGEIAVALGGGGEATLASLDRFAAAYRDGARAACRASTAGGQSPALADRRATCIDRARMRLVAVLDAIASGEHRDAKAAADSLPDLAACANLDALRRGDAPPLSVGERALMTAAETELAQAQAARDAGNYPAALDAVARARARAQQLGYKPLAARAAMASYELDLDRGDREAATSDAFDASIDAGASGDDELAELAELALLAEQASRDPAALDTFAALPADLPTSRGTARLYEALGKAQLDAQRYKDAEGSFRHAQAIRAKVLPDGHLERVLGDYWIAAALVEQRRDAEALPLLESVHRELEQLASPLRREAMEALHALGTAQARVGKIDEALASDREVLARRAKVFGPHAAVTAMMRFELASALSKAGKHGDAVRELDTVIADFTALHLETSVNMADARVNRAVDLTDLARYADAEASIALARPILVRAHGEDGPNVAIADLALATARIKRAEHGEHVELAGLDPLLGHVERVFTASFGAHSQPVSAVIEQRGELAAARGDHAGAIELYHRSLALLGPSDTADRAEELGLVARAQWTLGRKDAARASATEAIRLYQTLHGHADDIAELRARYSITTSGSP
ncbi:MAG TPA: serine/threonine-protein kinase, partial [Kofleriaceae bacterium]|nr:serine/threonine-protein kinase [Kofleriaceae bacterium]